MSLESIEMYLHEMRLMLNAWSIDSDPSHSLHAKFRLLPAGHNTDINAFCLIHYTDVPTLSSIISSQPASYVHSNLFAADCGCVLYVLRMSVFKLNCI